MSPKAKQILTVVISVLAIASSAVWVYWHQFKAPKHDATLHQHVGEVMAEETAKIAGNKGRIVIITIPTSGQPELETQLRAFKHKLETSGQYDFKEDKVDTEGKPKYGLGSGLSGRHFVRTVLKNEKAEAIVSFIGVPKLTDEEFAQLEKMPKFIAEARSTDHLTKLFEKKLIQAAVVSRFSFPAPGPVTPKTLEDRFNKRYQVLGANNAKTIPKSE